MYKCLSIVNTKMFELNFTILFKIFIEIAHTKPLKYGRGGIASSKTRPSPEISKNLSSSSFGQLIFTRARKINTK